MSGSELWIFDRQISFPSFKNDIVASRYVFFIHSEVRGREGARGTFLFYYLFFFVWIFVAATAVQLRWPATR